MSLIRWKSVQWRGGAGYSGIYDEDLLCMIFPAMPDHGLPSAYGMKFFSELYDAEACKTGRHIAIPLDSLEEGQRRAEEILSDGISRQHPIVGG
ncbi:hypothetical protein ACQZ46_23610 [Agrobacterium salinitolerans]